MSRLRVQSLLTGMGIALVAPTGCSAKDQGDVLPASGLESLDASTITPSAAVSEELQKASVLAAYTASRQAEGRTDVHYHLSRDGDTLAGHNAGQGFAARIDARGFEVAHEKGDWRARFETVALRCGNERTDVEASELRAVSGQPHRASIDRRFGRAAVEEWAINGPLGLEQGYTIPHDPCGGRAGEMIIEIAVTGVIPEAHGSVVELRDGQGNARARYGKLYAEDARGAEMDAILGVEGSRILIRLKTEGAKWPVTIDPLVWAQLAKLTATNGAPGDFFGESVALSGTTALIGAPEIRAPEEVLGTGAAYIFTKDSTGWSQRAKLLANDGASGDRFGYSVALSDTTALVGARSARIGTRPSQGAVYVFAQDGATWSQQAKLTANDGAVENYFGGSVALSGNTAVIGASGADIGANIDQGAAYVFAQEGTSWTQQAKLVATKGVANEYFGNSVALSGAAALVGAAEAGYVFVQSGAAWSQQAKLTASDGTPDDAFARSVALSGTTALIGAPNATVGANAYQGSAYVFAQSGKTWLQQAKLLAIDGAHDDRFGSSVALSGTTAIVGAPWANTESMWYQGAAYVFLQTGTAWSQQAKLMATNGRSNEYLGTSVALSGTTVLVGADERQGYEENERGLGFALVFDVVGGPCSSGSDCPASGTCVDGVCCDRPCTGPCAVCTQARGASSDGLCTPSPLGSPGSPLCESGLRCDGISLECPIMCADVMQCSPTEWCDTYDGICHPDIATGSACESGSQCLSGFCVDEVCCDAPCTGLCMACNSAQKGYGADGVCETIADGLDSQSECGTLGTDALCVADGVCNGSGLCRASSQGKPCGASSCLNTSTQTNAPKCDAAGTCQSDGTMDCGAYGCADGACRTSCNYGSCINPNGAICTAAAECASGFCVDGVCCNTACVGFCQACSAALKGHGVDGACEPIADGLDPQGECPSQGVDAACVSDGVCNGAELCRASSQGNVCGATSCASANTQLNAPKCNPVGACESSGSTDCGAYTCSGIACKTSCAADVDCQQPGFYCGVDACVPRLSNGAVCTIGNQCLSGYCADSVCCNVACGGLCQGCSASKKGDGADGVCEAIIAGQDPDDECGTDDPSTCQKDGTCDGQGSCRLHAKATPCGSVCFGNAVATKVCDGLGACNPATDSTDCGAYLCVGTACAKPCATDKHCASGHSCVAGECKPAGGTGSACTSAAGCTSGVCIDGVCCDTECKGQCEACNEQGSIGLCVAVSGNPRSPRPACEGVEACIGSCNGSVRTECTYPGAAVSCGSTCQNGTQTASSCNGAGQCTAGAETPCAPYACDGKNKCKTSCSANVDCAAGATCDATGHCAAADGGPPDGGAGAGSGGSGGETSGGAASSADDPGGCGCRVAGMDSDRRMSGAIASLGLFAIVLLRRRSWTGAACRKLVAVWFRLPLPQARERVG